jgi:hypothetical protein
VVVFERALRDGPHGLRGGRDAEHVGDLAYPPEIVNQFRHAPVSVRTPGSAQQPRYRKRVTA